VKEEPSSPWGVGCAVTLSTNNNEKMSRTQEAQIKILGIH
jgi:hypothetical protein